MIHDARRAPRRHVTDSVPVIDTMTDGIVGQLGNLSESGMLLIASAPLVEDGLYQLRFHLGGRSSPINVGVHVLWSVAANTPGQSWCGFRFLTISEEQRAHIREWVQAGEEATAG
ncbi:PilZ domain-containing protein [Pseudoxanthomonas suwonensis]|uniref:Pilus assembly protein PilZ n=1 Tax=Pseudoxanthomonas suwonensis TaxID=314722 RepID=A0A0E3Z0I0_9GAMM|nr:PilZ domain-containing protein [Pseudoxanthomonas suwonensis]AKC86137.1 pilus assembly protein PilZ [Pseudoxanthomonas suwonensis]